MRKGKRGLRLGCLCSQPTTTSPGKDAVENRSTELPIRNLGQRSTGHQRGEEEGGQEWARAFRNAGGNSEDDQSPVQVSIYGDAKYNLPALDTHRDTYSLESKSPDSNPISSASSLSSVENLPRAPSSDNGFGNVETCQSRNMFVMYANPLAISMDSSLDDSAGPSTKAAGILHDLMASEQAKGPLKSLVLMAEEAAATIRHGAQSAAHESSRDPSPPLTEQTPTKQSSKVSHVRTSMDANDENDSAVQTTPVIYLESNVPLSGNHKRFPSMGVDGVGVFARSNECSSNSSPVRSPASSAYSASPDTIVSSNPPTRSSSQFYATTGIRQSWDFQSSSSPIRKPSAVPSLRLSAVVAQGLFANALEEAMQEGDMAEADEASDDQKDVSSPVGSNRERNGNYKTDTPEKAKAAEVIQRPMSPLGNAISRINSGNYSPSSQGSGYNTPNTPMAASPNHRVAGNMQSSPFGRKAPATDATSISLAAAAQTRQQSLMGQAMAAGASPTRRRRRSRNQVHVDENCENQFTGPQSRMVQQEQQSPFASHGEAAGYGRILGRRSSSPMSGQSTHHRYHHLHISAGVRESLVEIGACETPTIPASDTPTAGHTSLDHWATGQDVMPPVVARALEARAAVARGEGAAGPSPEEVLENAPSHIRAMSESFSTHNTSIFGTAGATPVLPDFDFEDEEQEDRMEDLAWEVDESASGTDVGDMQTLDGLEGPAVSEEPEVRGSRRSLQPCLGRPNASKAGDDPLRRSVAQDSAGGSAQKSFASTGPFSLYSNKAFLEVGNQHSSNNESEPSSEGSLSQARASQILRSISDVVVAAKAQGPAPEAMPCGATFDAQHFPQPLTILYADENGTFKTANSGLHVEGYDTMPMDITPLMKQAPAAGLTPRYERLTPRTQHQHCHALLPTMTPRTRSTMDDMLQGKSLGSTFRMLVTGEQRLQEAAAGALYKLAQQESHKMAICRIEGGIEALAEAVTSLSTTVTRQACAGALAALASHPGCRAVVADRGAVPAFVHLTASERSEDQILAARGLGYFATMDPKRTNILDAGGAYALVCLLESTESRVREAAARALWNLAHAGEECRLAIGDAGSIEVLLNMAKSDRPAEAAAAAGAIWNIAASPSNQVAIAKANGIPVMAALFGEEGNPSAQLAAAGALCNLMLLPANRAEILRSGTVAALVEALHCCSPGMKPTIARALYILARSPDGCKAIISAGGCQPLIVEATNGNDMAAWALKGLLSDADSRASALEAGSLEALVSILCSPNSHSASLEAAVWAVKSLTDAEAVSDRTPKSDGDSVGIAVVMAAGGLSALFSGMSSHHATHSVREGAARACWNLVFQAEDARKELAATSRLVDIIKLVSAGSEMQCRQAAAGVLWNLSTHSESLPAVLSAGGGTALLKLAEDAGPLDEAARLACKAICSLSVDESGAQVLVKAGAIETLSKQLCPVSGGLEPAKPSNALIVALYNCLMARLRSIPPQVHICPADVMGAVKHLLECLRSPGRNGAGEATQGIWAVVLRALRGLVASPLAASALVCFGAVQMLGQLVIDYLDNHSGHEDNFMDEGELASAVWVLEGLAFQEAGQNAIADNQALLLALVHLIGNGQGADIRRAAVRIIHNLMVSLGPEAICNVGTTPGLLPALLCLAGDTRAPVNARESAAWSIKALLVQEAQRRDIVDLHGAKVICDLLRDQNSSHGSLQAAALALRNLATAPEHAAAIQAEGEAPMRRLVEILRTHEDQACCAAAASALANLSASEPLKMIILTCGGATSLTAALLCPVAATRQAAARAVANLAYHCPEASNALVQASAVPALVRMLKSKDKVVFGADVATAALAVSNMAAHERSRVALVSAGAVKHLLVALERLSRADTATILARSSTAVPGVPSAAPEEGCVRALWGLAPEARAAEQMATEGAVSVLLGLLSSAKGRRGVARACGGALRVLTSSEENRQAIVVGGGLEQLMAVLRSDPSPEAAEAAALACWDLAISRQNAAAMARAGAIPALVGLLCSSRPSTRHAAAGALHNIAFAEPTKDLVAAAGGVEALIGLLTPQTPECCVIAANTLKILALSAANKVHIPQSGGLQALVDLMLQEDIAGAQEAAAGALRNLANAKANKSAILEAGALPSLVKMMHGGRLEAKYAAAGALCNLAYNSSVAVKESIVDAGVVGPLVAALPGLGAVVGEGEQAAIGELAARTLWNLASGSDRNRQAIGGSGGIEALIGAAGCSHPQIRGIAAGALSHLAIDRGLKEAISDAGGVEVLARILQEGSSAEGFQAASSVLRNLAVLPSAKAALMNSGLVPVLLERLHLEGGTGAEREAAKGILRNLAFNSQLHAAEIREMAGQGLDGLLS